MDLEVVLQSEVSFDSRHSLPPTVELLASEPPSCFCALSLAVVLQRDKLTNSLSLYALL